jgi:uncharacterized membrane protein
MEKKIKHLEFIQTIINRMAGNSFLIKGWAITLVAALFALSSKDANKNYIIISFLPVIIFWILDAYFLSRERAFRCLYDKVRNLDENKIDFSLDISQFKERKNNWFWSMFSHTILFFYTSLIGAMLIIAYIIR